MGEWFPKVCIGELPRLAARDFGGREALVFQGRRWTFAQFEADVQRAARALLSLGIGPGEKVSLWMPNRPEWLHLLFAICRIGAVLVPVNTKLQAAEVAYILKQSNSTTFICTDLSGPADYRPIVQELLPELAGHAAPSNAFAEYPDLKRVVSAAAAPMPGTHDWNRADQWTTVTDSEANERAAAVDPDATALILYTSGTTGFPKGVMHSHAWVRNAVDCANRMGVTIADTILTHLPLYHGWCLGKGPFASLICGARQVLVEQFIPGPFLDLIASERVTTFIGFESHFSYLIESQEQCARDVSSLRVAVCAAGMASTTPVARRANRVLVRTISSYGTTELGNGAAMSPLDATEEQRCAASGYPGPGYELAIVDAETQARQPAGTPGEILVRGYMVMQGYHGLAAETAKAVDQDGWLHTGDLGYLRPDGHLCLMGRLKDMIKSGGENVDPIEVESMLLTHPGILYAAVVSLADSRLQEVPVAFVVPKPGHTLTSLVVLDYGRKRIAAFKLPRHVVLVESLPMTASGKVQKTKLRESAAQLLPTLPG